MSTHSRVLEENYAPLMNARDSNRSDNSYRAEFYTPPPPTPENTLLGVGGRIKGGGYKNPAAGGFKIHTPPPPPP